MLYKRELTGREMSILVFAADGLKNREIAQKLGVSEQAVKNHLSALYRKIGARDKAHAIAIAMRTNLIA